MRLIYRGASYEYDGPSLEVRQTDVLRWNRDANQRCRTLREARYPLIYRGVRYTTDQVADALSSTPASRSSQTMIYRGVEYVKNPDGSISFAGATKTESIPHTTTSVFREIARVHRDNMRQNLERRLQAARKRGDQSLVDLLEAESRQLAL